jgi:hypothetical protein
VRKEIEVIFSNKKKKNLRGGENCQKRKNERRYNASIVEEK